MIDLIEDVTADEIQKDQELEKDAAETGAEVKSEDTVDSEVNDTKPEVDEAEADTDSDVANQDMAAATAGITQTSAPTAGEHQKLMDKVMKKVTTMTEEELQGLAQSFEKQPAPDELAQADIDKGSDQVATTDAPKAAGEVTEEGEENEEQPEVTEEDSEEDSEEIMEASANDSLDGFASQGEIIAAVKKIAGVSDHLKKIKASIYFDDVDFVVGEKTAVRDALFNANYKISDLAKAILQSQGNQQAEPQRDDRVIVAAKSESDAKKISDLVKANNAKASSEDRKAKVQIFARKNGFKVYITGNSVAAVAPYKRMAEATETYDEVSSDEEFMEYAKEVLKAAHGDKYDEEIAMKTAKGILDKAEGDYGVAVGMLTSGLDEESDEDEAEDEVDMSEDVKALVSAEANLTEGFKSKAKTIFEAAVKTKVRQAKGKLQEEYAIKLTKQTNAVKAQLTEKVDSYLSYVVENWMKENKVAIDAGLRTEVAERFISSLKGVFAEHYIEVPTGKTNIVEELNDKVAKLTEQLAQSEKSRQSLKNSADKLQRQSILAEASVGLAATQAAKLNELAKDVSFESADAFKKKVVTIKEAYFRKPASVKAEKAVTGNKISTEVIIEGVTDANVDVSPEMKQYLAVISRVERNNPNK